MESPISFLVNGEKVKAHEDPLTPLESFLRRKLRLTGTKLACGEGGCGACTILVSRRDPNTQEIRHQAVNACLLPLAWAHGTAVTTIEGLGNTKTGLHPLQRSLADHHGSQCGMCSPGMVMSVQGLLTSNTTPPTATDIEDTLSGNLCRCTGYRTIYDAFVPFSKDCDGSGEKQKQCLSALKIQTDKLKVPRESATFKSARRSWFSPVTLDELLSLRAEHSDSVLVLGYTTTFWAQKAGYPPSVVISGARVPELFTWQKHQGHLEIGAGLTITQFVEVVEKITPDLTEYQKSALNSVARMLQNGFGTHQLRNVATIGGSICSGSSGSDILTAFAAIGCDLNIISKDGEREVSLDEEFLEAGKAALGNKEVLLSVKIPFAGKKQVYKMHKHVLRKGAQSELTVAMCCHLGTDTGPSVLSSARVYVGSLGKRLTLMTSVINTFTATKLITKDSLLEAVKKDAPNTSRYKSKSLVNILLNLHSEIVGTEKKEMGIELRPLTSTQVFTSVSDDQHPNDFVGRPLVHQSAYQQCTGEAVFIDDLPEISNELFLCFVKSTQTHADILSVHPTKALAMKGVVDFVWHDNVPDAMKPYFPKHKVEFHSQVIGFVLAGDRETAREAAKKIKIEYATLEPVLNMKTAMEKKEFLLEKTLSKGDAAAALECSDKVAVGFIELGAQEHWYLETQSCRVVPGEAGELDVLGSFQAVSIHQHAIAIALGLPANKVVCRVKRIGGGFGGKDSGRAILMCVPTAYAAHKHGRPVRNILERKEDICISGHRPPYVGYYKLGADEDGTINALDIEVFNDAGWKLDNAAGMLQWGMACVDNCYRIPNIHVVGRVCKTNTVSKPPMRGYGSLELIMLTEASMDDAARQFAIHPMELRRKNLLKTCDTNVTNDVMEGCTAQRCWDEVMQQSDFWEREKQIAEFNKTSSNLKRGIYAVPTKMAANYSNLNPVSMSMNRASALVNPYQDGTVLISHNGVEMGQGLHTKMIQIASRELEIPPDVIYIAETRSDNLCNGTVSSASACTDVNGVAVMDACIKLKKTLAPYMRAHPAGAWKDWVTAAVSDRVSLSTVGVFRKEDRGVFDWETGAGEAFPYYTYGAGVSEVEIDCTTGKYRIIQADLVMDVGKSLNPTLDVGQIEGAFMQAVGWLTTESFEYTDDGRVKSTSLGSYILPGIENIPREFNVSLLKDTENTWVQSIYSSKGIGEPPATLAGSVFFAIRRAIAAKRESSGLKEDFLLTSPATASKILDACSQ